MSPSWDCVSQRMMASNPKTNFQPNQHQLFLLSVCFQVVEGVLSRPSTWKSQAQRLHGLLVGLKSLHSLGLGALCFPREIVEPEKNHTTCTRVSSSPT